jgi:dTDP-4-amino-4,6-dideoxygalactose transaminase
VNPVTYNLDVTDAEKRITAKTKAILLVHQIGMPADIDSFKALCLRRNILLIEDAACAAGSSYKGKKIGSHSDLVCFSFHPRKVITTGDGGMITTSSEQVSRRLKLLRQHGMSVNDRDRHTAGKLVFEDHLEVGYNYRLTDIQASVGIRQLERLDWLLSERRKIAEKYLNGLADISCIRLPSEEPGYRTNFQSFSIYLHDNAPLTRNQLMEQLLEKGISSRRGIMTAHRETAYKDTSSGQSLPVSEKACDQSIIIPLFVPMTNDEITHVISSLRELLT